MKKNRNIDKNTILNINCHACKKDFTEKVLDIPHNKRFECPYCSQGYVINIKAYIKHEKELDELVERLDVD